MKKTSVYIICFALIFFSACKKEESSESQTFRSTCTPIEYAEKAKSVTDSVTLLKESDTEKYKEAVARMQIIADNLRQNPQDLNSACTALDILTVFLQ